MSNPDQAKDDTDGGKHKGKKETIKIGNYILGRTIGVGSFGKVKLGEHQLTHHVVAVKVLNRKKIKSLNMDSKVRREISIMKLFNHPHVVKLYEVIGTDRNIFMIMEFISGGEMFDYIVTKGKIPEDEARRFFQQIISGVEYCHKHKVVHRDLKPENILLDSKNNVKIGDFGLSNMMRDGDFLTTSCGSPNYAAPEVIAGKMYAGPGVDVWSCGVILFALLCSRLPFDDSSLEALFQKIKTGSYTMPHTLPADAKDLIGRMLTVDPVKRITIPEIRHHPWFLKNLPEYLATPIDDSQLYRVKAIDSEVVEEICRLLHITTEQCLKDLQRSSNTTTQAAVMYMLIMDQKRDRSQGIQQVETHHVEIPEFAGIEMRNYVETIPDDGKRSTSKDEPGPTPADGSLERKWTLGADSDKSPPEIMNELFTVLKQLNFEWRMVSTYQLHCRLRQTPKSTMARQPIEISIQLFRLDDRSSVQTSGSRPKYKIDMRRLTGDTFPFMALCSAILGNISI
ncbi:putative Serine/threonine protein kinase OSK3 [Blattamonas nauphoetae]|uniref:non-specific serine/threonine protein kinase n=1 Tax=Blattamonas nauphoetae TaxID=2049346 RepID=A0ABQ9XVQ7_9EUKA|nr:putative Serine/threonine protein kinase OSK3 [Blattamonas nauphoetae]